MAAPTVNECRFPVDVVYTWVDGDDPDVGRRPRGADLPGWTGTAQTREASGRARFVDRDELRYSLRSRAPVRPVGPPHPPRHQRPGAGLARRSTTPGRRSSTTRRDPAGRRAADLQLARDRDLAAPHPRAGRALASTSTTTSSSAGRCGPRRCSARPDCRRCSSRRPRSGSPTCPTRRRSSRPRGTTAACCRTPSARSRPTRSPTRRTPYRTSVLREIEQRFADVVGATTRSPFRSDTDISTLSSLRPALRAADRDGVRRRGRHRVRQPRQPRPRLAALAAAGTASRTSSASATTTTTASAQGRLDELLTDVLARVLPRRGAVGEGLGPSPSGGRSPLRPRRAAS